MRLTQEQAAAVDRTATKWEKPAIEAVAAHSDGEALGAMHCRVLDLLDLLRAATTRAEQAEKDRDALAKLAHAFKLRDQRKAEDEATDIESDGTFEALEQAESALSEAWRAASGALDRAKGGA